MKVRDVIKLIEADGWRLVSIRGSHRQFKHPCELLPRPEGRGFPAASSFLRRHSPLASGHVLREFSVSVSLAQTYIRFAITATPQRLRDLRRSRKMHRFRSHRTGSGCSLPTLWNRLANPKSPRGRSDRSSK